MTKRVVKTCLGMQRVIYELQVTDDCIKKLESFGNVKVFDFAKRLVKIKSKGLDMSFVIPSEQIMVTYRDKNLAIEVENALGIC